MKIGTAPAVSNSYEVKLPQEIVVVIVSHIELFTSEDLKRKTLCACCLLSRSWYSTAVPYLYETPQLSNKNFDKFARTLCPPVNSHVRHIGLESFVRHLDMGKLAYESSKSLTARLLRRTRESLETFTAPAVSFSVACLAPLSKCRRMRTLDLSRDHYDIDLTQLLDAIGGLPHLISLSLPRSAMRRCKLEKSMSEEGHWPVHLSHLQINDCLPQEISHWQKLLASWPSSLVSLAFEDCLNWNPFFQLHQSGAVGIHIRSLRIGMRREEDGFPIEILLASFPGTLSLAIPTPVGIPDFATTLSELPGAGRRLTSLVFRLAPDVVQPKPKISTDFLLNCTKTNPSLTRIEVPESYLRIGGNSADDLEAMEELMSSRAKGVAEDTGVYLVEE